MTSVDRFTISGAGSYSVEEAQRVLAGYAFARQNGDYRQRSPSVPGEDPSPGWRPRWAYRTYDCVPAGPGKGLTDIDLFVGVGLNSRQNAATMGSLLLVRDEVSECLEQIPSTTRFWEQGREELFGDGDGPTSGSVGWWMIRAWALLMGAQDVGIATTHKLLHHKRPGLFPILDWKTKEKIGRRGERWLAIWRDLTANEGVFGHLESWFAELADEREGVRLTHLRIHDILVWVDVVGHRSAAIEAGRGNL